MRISRGTFYTVVSVIVAAGVFVSLLRSVSIDEVVRLILDADKRGVALFILLSLSMSFFRMWRYLVLLRVSGYSPARLPMFLMVLVRNLFADLLPARIGTLVYVFIVTNRLGVPVQAAVSSFAFAFLFDLIAIVPMVLLALFVVTAGGGGGLPVGGLLFATAVLAGVLYPLLRALAPLTAWGASVVRRASFVSERLRERASITLEGVQREVERTQQAGIFWRLLWLSVLVRATKYGALYVFLVALLFPKGYTLSDLPLAKVFLGICAAELSSSLPISGIAGFGLYQGTWVVVFQLLGFPLQMAKVTSLSHHIFTQAYGYSLGLVAMCFLALPFFRAGAVRGAQVEHAGRFYARLLSATCGLLLALLVVHRVLTPVAAEAGEESGESLVFQTVVGADREGELANEGERQRAHQILRELSAEVVFDSNRSGTFGIYRVKSGSVEPEVIIDTPERHEVFPDVSLDGNFIVFASARSAGRNAEADIWMVRPDGVGAKRIAENGTFPTVSSDGKRVYFERDRVRLMVVELEGGGERELFPGGASNEWGGYQVIKPRVSPDGSGVVFTSDREGRWSAWAVELASGKGRRIARGCEPGWWGIENFWVKKSGAKERSGIYVKNGENEVPLIDRDAPWGHEYFPTVTGEVLLYAACPPNQHAHESSNYQLFLTQVGRNGVPTRLTFDRHTNRWPKLLRRSGAGE